MEQLKFLDKNVGILRDDKVFIGHRYPKHIFHKFNGLGMSVQLLLSLRRAGCKKIILLLHRESGIIEPYQATPEKFLEEGAYWCDRKADYQRILSFNQLNQKKLTKEYPPTP